jgi:hypothetical protein
MTENALALDASDFAMRNWTSRDAGPVRIGSPEHMRLFSRMLLETHNPYKPAVIDWPELSPDALARVTSLPVWDIAVQTEGRASIRVKTFAETVREPVLREALELDANEEARHKVVLSKLVEAYGIKLAPEPDYDPPKDVLWAWLVTGYSECIDSFFAFGLFETARRSGYFPEALVETFEPVIQEEARHILFFANWVAWRRRNIAPLERIKFRATEIAVWAFLIYERIGIARGLDDSGEMQDANFTMQGSEAIGVDLSPGQLIDRCLSEYDRRMAGYDPRLLRPDFVPTLARFARRFMKK